MSKITDNVEEVLDCSRELTEEIIDSKFRDFMVLLYEDTATYDFDSVLAQIKSMKYYAYIKHHPESGEKKTHFHVILHFDNAKKVSTLSKQLGVPERFIRVIKSKRQANRYLIHKDDDDKFQYQLSDVFVSRLYERHFKTHFDDLKTESDIIDEIYSFIDNLILDDKLSFQSGLRSIILFVNTNCYDTIYKRYRLEFLDYFKSLIYK